MNRARSLSQTLVAFGLLLVSGPAGAQEADIEAGATTEARYSAPAPRGVGGSDLRIGAQLRLDALNALGLTDTTPGNTGAIGRRLLVPLVAPGVRLADQKLFLGLGLGFQGWSTEDQDGDEQSRSGF